MNPTVKTLIEELKLLVLACDEDTEKVDRGQRAAGTRLRSQMQLIKAKCQEIRKAAIRPKDTVTVPPSPSV